MVGWGGGEGGVGDIREFSMIMLPPKITHQYCRRDEGEAWVLHSSIGEGGREDEQVIGTPDVSTDNLLGRC